MRSVFYRVDTIGSGFLAIMARPRGGDTARDEILAFRQAGIKRIVSLLELHEEFVLGLELERRHCRDAGIAFVSFPIPDRGVPSNASELSELSKKTYLRCSAGENAAIHCRAGIGRSSLVAASVLLHGGMSVDDAFSKISVARGFPVPDTSEQVEWLRQHAYTVLTGTLV
jgi:protein-tyrosine phosphatase